MLKRDGVNQNSERTDDFMIEEWLVQPQLNRITANEQRIQVQPKIMDVLVCMASQPGKVVTKEHLFSVVWAGTHVTEHVLSRSISQLRKIFHDSAQQPRVIETIPKVGYRLIATVVKVNKAQAERAHDEAERNQPLTVGPSITRWQRAKLWIGLGALSGMVILLAVIALLLLLTRNGGHRHFHLLH